MKILQVHNRYRIRSGEETVVDYTVSLLRGRGERVLEYFRSSGDLPRNPAGRLAAFVSGVYNPGSVQRMRHLLRKEHPDIVEIHNIFPLISPAVLAECGKNGTPVVMRCHNFRLLCPIGDVFRNGRICEQCAGGKEYWCAINNCRNSRLESAAYALRSALARMTGAFRDNITTFIALTRFAKRKLTETGIPESRMAVLPNSTEIPEIPADPGDGGYIAYLGQVTPKKGVPCLIEAARRTGIPIRIAGDASGMGNRKMRAPENVVFTGFLDHARVVSLLRNARLTVVPSEWFEMFPMVILEAMAHGLPVVASNIGGLPEIVDDGVTGLLFQPGNAEELAEAMQLLWNDPRRCREMGRMGREKAVREYSGEVHYQKLMAIYRKAIKRKNGSPFPASPELALPS